ncbi:hypothetical protein D3C85_1783720 [compost metagenome]
MTAENRQKVGYDLEHILKELFAISEIDYKEPYKTETQQIDGHFKFEGLIILLKPNGEKTRQTKMKLVVFNEKLLQN